MQKPRLKPSTQSAQASSSCHFPIGVGPCSTRSGIRSPVRVPLDLHGWLRRIDRPDDRHGRKPPPAIRKIRRSDRGRGRQHQRIQFAPTPQNMAMGFEGLGVWLESSVGNARDRALAMAAIPGSPQSRAPGMGQVAHLQLTSPATPVKQVTEGRMGEIRRINAVPFDALCALKFIATPNDPDDTFECDQTHVTDHNLLNEVGRPPAKLQFHPPAPALADTARVTPSLSLRRKEIVPDDENGCGQYDCL